MASDTITVYVRNCRGGNALPIQCKDDDKISALAANLQKNAKLFDIDPDDIKLYTLELYRPMPNAEKKKVEFFERITTLSDNDFLVEFDHHPVEKLEVKVKYVNSVHPIKIKCGVDDEISDLPDKILENLSKFPLSTEDYEHMKATGSEMQFFVPSPDGDLQQLDSEEKISTLKKKFVVFKFLTNEMKQKVKDVKFYLRHEKSQQGEFMIRREDDKVQDVIRDIKGDIKRFGLSTEDQQELDNPEKVMVLTKRLKTGNLSVVMRPYDSVIYLKDKEVVFGMKDKEDQEERAIIDKIENYCVNQTIAFFGAPGHGKSSTINTIGQVIPGIDSPIADVWKGTAAGTIVFSSFPIEVGNHKFNLLDVPGNGLPQYDSASDEKKAREVIRWIMQGSFPEDAKPDFWTSQNIVGAWFEYMKKKTIGRVDMVVIVHKAVAASPDKLNNLVVDEARKRKKNGIPVCAVITHIDEVQSAAELQMKIKQFSEITGIDESAIFPISNLSDESYLKESERECKILSMLVHVLSRSKKSKLPTKDHQDKTDAGS